LILSQLSSVKILFLFSFSKTHNVSLPMQGSRGFFDDLIAFNDAVSDLVPGKNVLSVIGRV